MSWFVSWALSLLLSAWKHFDIALDLDLCAVSRDIEFSSATLSKYTVQETNHDIGLLACSVYESLSFIVCSSICIYSMKYVFVFKATAKVTHKPQTVTTRSNSFVFF